MRIKLKDHIHTAVKYIRGIRTDPKFHVLSINGCIHCTHQAAVFIKGFYYHYLLIDNIRYIIGPLPKHRLDECYCNHPSSRKVSQ